jgi:hypothetical protein
MLKDATSFVVVRPINLRAASASNCRLSEEPITFAVTDHSVASDSVVHFLFEDVTDVEFDGLDHQNVLSGMDFDLVLLADGKTPLRSVELNHCPGLSAGFKAARAGERLRQAMRQVGRPTASVSPRPS